MLGLWAFYLTAKGLNLGFYANTGSTFTYWAISPSQILSSNVKNLTYPWADFQVSRKTMHHSVFLGQNKRNSFDFDYLLEVQPSLLGSHATSFPHHGNCHLSSFLTLHLMSKAACLLAILIFSSQVANYHNLLDWYNKQSFSYGPLG